MGITSPDGMELLIHVGVDTVDMKGDGFACLVQEGQTVKAGDKLLTFDRKKIAAAGHPDMVAVLLTNADDFGAMTVHSGPLPGFAAPDGSSPRRRPITKDSAAPCRDARQGLRRFAQQEE